LIILVTETASGAGFVIGHSFSPRMQPWVAAALMTQRPDRIDMPGGDNFLASSW
jgi:hypothetical protein